MSDLRTQCAYLLSKIPDNALYELRDNMIRVVEFNAYIPEEAVELERQEHEKRQQQLKRYKEAQAARWASFWAEVEEDSEDEPDE